MSLPENDLKDPFIEKHLNRIRTIQALNGSKKLFVECFPTDEGALCFPNSNRAVKEIFIEDYPESPSSLPEDGEGKGLEWWKERWSYIQKHNPGRTGNHIEDLIKELLESKSVSAAVGKEDEIKKLVEKGLRTTENYDWETGDPGDIISRLENILSQISLLLIKK